MVHGFLDTTGIDTITLRCACSARMHTRSRDQQWWSATSCIRGYVSAGGGEHGDAQQGISFSDVAAGGKVSFSTTYPGTTGLYTSWTDGVNGGAVDGNNNAGGAGTTSPARVAVNGLLFPYMNNHHTPNTSTYHGAGVGTVGDPMPIGPGAGGAGGYVYGTAGQPSEYYTGPGAGQNGAAGAVVLIYNV